MRHRSLNASRRQVYRPMGHSRIVAMASPKERANHRRGRHPWGQNSRTNKSRQDLSHLQKKPVKNDTFATSPGWQLRYFAETVSPNTQALHFRNIAQSTQASRSFRASFSIGTAPEHRSSSKRSSKTQESCSPVGSLLPSLPGEGEVTLWAKI